MGRDKKEGESLEGMYLQGYLYFAKKKKKVWKLIAFKGTVLSCGVAILWINQQHQKKKKKKNQKKEKNKTNF